MWAGLRAEQAVAFWPQLLPLVEKGLEHGRGEFTANDVLQKLAEREMQAWVVFDNDIQALVITEIRYFPAYKVLNVFLAAGSMIDEWFPYLEEVIEPFGGEKKALEIGAYCRPGMVRLLEKRGWEKAYTVMRKRL